MKSEIDGLQIQAGERSKPWYRQASTVIAVIALLFSAATTYYANVRTAEQEVRAARAELGQLIQRLSALPKENMELRASYADNLEVLGALGGSIATETLVLGQQAADVIDRLPDDVSATEYYAVANALMQSGFYPRAQSLTERGLQRDADLTTKASLRRTQGNLFFLTGPLAEGRREMKRALDLYADQPDELRASASAYTEIFWASAEESAGQCQEVTSHADQAEELVSSKSETEFRRQLTAMIIAARSPAGRCP